MVVANLFPLRLRELREKAGLTQGQLAEEIGVSRVTLSTWETGDHEPSWSDVVKLAKAFNMTPDTFIEKSVGFQKSKMGRPPKPKPPDGEAKPKRPRGRPKKRPPSE